MPSLSTNTKRGKPYAVDKQRVVHISYNECARTTNNWRKACAPTWWDGVYYELVRRNFDRDVTDLEQGPNETNDSNSQRPTSKAVRFPEHEINPACAGSTELKKKIPKLPYG